MPYAKSCVYTIYSYTAPDGRMYIGKTGLQKGARAQAQGAGYRSSSKFWKAIQRYGWDSFTYAVLATVSKQEPDSAQKACDLESQYIKKYKTNNVRFGFNTNTKDSPKNYDKLKKSRLNVRPMHKDGIVKQVPPLLYNKFLQEGWIPGYIHKS